MRTLAIVAIILLLAACHQINHGQIVGKEIERAHTDLITVPVTTFCGKACFMVTPVQTWVFYPEAYSFQVFGHDKQGNGRTERFYVSSGEFDSKSVGDVYSCGEAQGCQRDRVGLPSVPEEGSKER